MTTTTATESDRAEWHARDATPTEALNAWTERAAKLEAESARLRRELDEPQPVTLDDAYAAIRGAVEENKRLSAEVKELRRGPAGTIAEAIDLIRDQARDSEGVIDTVLRLIEGQSEPASPRMLAAIEGQARDGESPDQTVERLIRERDFAESQRQLFVSASNIDGELLDEIRAALGAPDGADVTEHARAVAADLRRAEHDLARLIAAVRDNTSTWGDVVRACDEIADLGAPGWLELALSDVTDVLVRQERAAWEARVSEAVQEGERRIDAVEKERKKLATRVAELRDERERLRDALARIAAYLGVTDAANTTAIVEGAAAAREELDEARLLGHAPGLVIAIQTAVPAIRDGLNAGGSHAPEAVQARNEARDSLHALEAAVEGQPPAAVLSAAERKAVEALRRWRELPDERIGDPFAAEWLDVIEAADAMIEAGRPLASEGKEG